MDENLTNRRLENLPQKLDAGKQRRKGSIIGALNLLLFSVGLLVRRLVGWLVGWLVGLLDGWTDACKHICVQACLVRVYVCMHYKV
jgi:hypothetical protein